MVKRITVNYLVAAIITILVIMIELSVRSPILSPFLLIDDHKKEPVSQKIMAGFSSFQGNYLMNISSLKQGEEREPAFGFHLGSKSYTFYQLKDTPNLQIDKALLQASTLEVNTRKGVIAVFEEGAHSSFEGGSGFLNRYQITRENGSLPVRVTFESEFTRELGFWSLPFFSPFPRGSFFMLSNGDFVRQKNGESNYYFLTLFIGCIVTLANELLLCYELSITLHEFLLTKHLPIDFIANLSFSPHYSTMQ
ncbi:hypothetical protein [Caldalkalibacillus mannanilyticus]|uniref:hypothetical protein n=1 Tax=Caldalkalibacillus mannanilyticus TaxID=1418 RepID=UPI000468BCF9|nr:hypothetical protein [Caldalkalibacillus mannanilyticus]